MREPGFHMFRRDRQERCTQRFQQSIEGARFGRAQRLLDLGPTQLNRIEVGGIGWQVDDLHATRLQVSPGFGIFVGSLSAR